MEDAAAEDTEMSGAAEFAPALVAAHPVALPPPARHPDESCPPLEFTAEEEEEASSSASSGKAPMPEALPEDLTPTPRQAAAKKKKKTTKKKVTLQQSHLDALMTVAEWEPLEPIDEEWLKSMTALIPNGEQFFAERGFTVEKLRELDDMSFVVKAQTDLVAEIQKQQREKGYVEMDISDDDEEGGWRAPNWRWRRRLRPGVCKKPSGEIRKIFY